MVVYTSVLQDGEHDTLIDKSMEQREAIDLACWFCITPNIAFLSLVPRQNRPVFRACCGDC